MTLPSEGMAKIPDDDDVPYLAEAYVATRLRSPRQPLIEADGMAEVVTHIIGPATRLFTSELNDLTRQHKGEPLGQRIIVAGRVMDEFGQPVPGCVVEIWQANAAGRYAHIKDQWDAPLDPNFTGTGRVITDDKGFYSFTTIRPGAYPWGNHDNAWRPAHIHFSLLGPSIGSRLITQMYFPDDPLIAIDPIAQAVPEAARHRLVASLDLNLTKHKWALGYRFDIVLRGSKATPFEDQ